MRFLGPERRHRDRRKSASLSVRPTYARIDRSAIKHNLETIAERVGHGIRMLAVVKANGYGHGAIEVADVCAAAGIWGFAVSLVEEGIELRRGGVTSPVLVLGGVYSGFEDVIVHRNLTPVVWAYEHLQRLASAVRRSGAQALRIHLKIDTGMSRLGLLVDELPAVMDFFASEEGELLQLEGVMTHLACADEPDDQVTPLQLKIFADALGTLAARGLHPQFRHVCNSAGVFRYPGAYFDMVRPGVAMYGAASREAVELPGLRMAMSVHTRILGVRDLPRGSFVSYGQHAELSRASRLGIIPCGYADGYSQRMSGQAEVLVRGHRCRVVGDITMDTLMVDLTDLPDPREGERVTLLGRQGRQSLTIYDLAAWSGEIPHEIMCRISRRIPRR